MTFFNQLKIKAPILKALTDAGYESATEVQDVLFSKIMSGANICAISQTGTGKTLAYILPSVCQWQFSKEIHPQVLIVVPTRELVKQVQDEVVKISKYLNLVCLGFYGGVNMRPQMAAAIQGCDIIVSTPGRLIDLVLNGAVKLKQIRKLVIDEMDEMLNLGFQNQIRQLFDLLPKSYQTVLLSATVTGEVKDFIDQNFDVLQWVKIAESGKPIDAIRQLGYYIPNYYTKLNMLEHLLSKAVGFNRILIFVSTKKKADIVFKTIQEKYAGKVGIIHSNKEQNYRFDVIDKFDSGVYKAIIATDIVARGIDIDLISHVINFDIPDMPENYIHRIGRTGRNNNSGTAISFISDTEKDWVQEIEKLMQKSIEILPIPEEVEITTALTFDEQPKKALPSNSLKSYNLNLPKQGAFHEKKASNLKKNIVVSHKEKMNLKYGKPKKRKSKK